MRGRLLAIVFILALAFLNACGVPGVGTVGLEPAGGPSLPSDNGAPRPQLIQGCLPVTRDGAAVVASRVTDSSVASTTWTSGGYIRVDINNSAIVKTEYDEEVNGEKRWYFDQSEQAYARHAKGLQGDDVVEVCAQGDWSFQQ